MGVLIDGKWTDGELPQETSQSGQFKRADSVFRGRITRTARRASKPNPAAIIFMSRMAARGRIAR